MDGTIDDFFENANILITGGSGFIGKVLIEKLLRSQPKTNKLYLLIRPKKGKTIEERVDKDIFSKVIFDELKRTQPDFMKKIVVIPGDILEPQLGLSAEHRKLLQNEVNVVYNSAASVNMSASLKASVKSNIYSVMMLLDLCNEMKSLKSLVIVSTAFSNCNREVIEEKIYKPSLNPNLVFRMCEEMDDNLMRDITPSILDKHPNTYTYSKCIMEYMLEDYKNLPIVIFRPGVVIPAYSEPLAGWVDNYNGAVGLIFGCALGIIRVFHADKEKELNWVPVDLCTNALICSAWHGTQSRNRGPLSVYNFAFNKQKASLKDVLVSFRKSEVQLNSSIWKTCYVFTNNIYIYYVLRYLLHYLPALFIDFFLALSNNPLRLQKLYNDKVHPFTDVLRYFSCNSWIIKENNTEIMWKDLSESERQCYPFFFGDVSVHEMIKSVCIGVKVYLAGEKIEDNYKALHCTSLYSTVVSFLWHSVDIVRDLSTPFWIAEECVLRAKINKNVCEE